MKLSGLVALIVIALFVVLWWLFCWLVLPKDLGGRRKRQTEAVEPEAVEGEGG